MATIYRRCLRLYLLTKPYIAVGAVEQLCRAKYTYVAGKTVNKEAAFAIARAYRSQKLRRLIEECYSPDRATRAMARAKLKTQYPEIYSICDFSKERISSPAMKQKWVRRIKAYY